MKVQSLFLALAFAASLHAQTLTMTINGPATCANSTALTLYCYGVPVTASDGTRGQIWMDYHLLTSAQGFISFLGNYENLDGGTSYSAEVTSVNPDGSVNFIGTTTNGRAYLGTLSFDYYTYRKCGRLCENFVVVTSGNLAIVYQ